MDAKRNSSSTSQPTVLGTFEISLLVDPGEVEHATVTHVRSTGDKVARDLVLAVGALLFAQRQVRMVKDPNRLSAVEEIESACRASRAGTLTAPIAPANARTASIFTVQVLAGSSFGANIEDKLNGMVMDIAGGFATGGLASELLTTLSEPYRTFYREMLEAAIGFWRERRPSLMESTWSWTAALQRLNQLIRQGTEGIGEPQACETCHALRPAGAACLRCGAVPSSSATTTVTPAVPTFTTAPPPPPPPVVAPPIPPTLQERPVVSPSPAPVLTPALAGAPSATGTARDVSPMATETKEAHIEEPSILRAQEPAALADANEAEAPLLAGIVRRGLAMLVDVILGVLLAGFGGFGLTAILMAAGSFGPSDSPSQFASGVAVVIFALYFVAGWAHGGTYGMMLFHLHIVHQSDQRRIGLFPALGRGIGYVLLLAFAGAVFVIGNLIDNQLVFIQGTADTAVRVIIGLISLYILWSGSGQAIISQARRQTWADRFARTLVVLRASGK
ncbi:MAG TPA: RDD family protein, partial [Chloroflexota bacterium]|nr:RDD family protein [Chloroflexota bacterium]